MVNSVSFGNDNFSTLIAQPPANAAQNTATSIPAQGLQQDTLETSGGTGKKIVKTAVGLAAILGGLACLRKYVGTFSKIDLTGGMEAQTGFMGKVNYGIAKAGEWVLDCCKTVKGWFGKNADDAKKGADDATSGATRNSEPATETAVQSSGKNTEATVEQATQTAKKEGETVVEDAAQGAKKGGETSKTEAPKADAESTKPDASKANAETTKTDAPKADADAPKTDASKADAPTTKVEGEAKK